jgi:hypothetical protein
MLGLVDALTGNFVLGRIDLENSIITSDLIVRLLVVSGFINSNRADASKCRRLDKLEQISVASTTGTSGTSGVPFHLSD